MILKSYLTCFAGELYDAGFVCRDKVLDVANTLKKFTNLHKSRLNQMSKKSYKCFNDNFNLNSNNNKLADLLMNY